MLHFIVKELSLVMLSSTVNFFRLIVYDLYFHVTLDLLLVLDKLRNVRFERALISGIRLSISKV